MINRDQLKKFKNVLGFNLWQLEKDYLQHLFLFFLSKELSKCLVFKGGTALQKTYGLNRFSIDLDFTLTNNTLNLKQLFGKIKRDMTEFGYLSSFKTSSEKNSIKTLFKTEGPLFDGTKRSMSTLRLDISTREKIELEPVLAEVVPAYPDLQPYFVMVMNLKEMLAEKIRAIITRKKARDVYDAWFLLKKGTNFSKELASKKLAFYDKKFNINEFNNAIKIRKKFWQKELGLLMTTVPDFEEIKKTILNKISD